MARDTRPVFAEIVGVTQHLQRKLVIPFAKNFRQTWRWTTVVNELSISLIDNEWWCDQVRDIDPLEKRRHISNYVATWKIVNSLQRWSPRFLRDSPCHSRWCWRSHKGCTIKCLAYAARIDGTHGIVRATLLVTLNSMLHGQTTIKHDVNERGIWQVRRGRQGDSGELQVGRWALLDTPQVLLALIVSLASLALVTLLRIAPLTLTLLFALPAYLFVPHTLGPRIKRSRLRS